jgi:hypothetical protein
VLQKWPQSSPESLAEPENHTPSLVDGYPSQPCAASCTAGCRTTRFRRGCPAGRSRAQCT